MKLSSGLPPFFLTKYKVITVHLVIIETYVPFHEHTNQQQLPAVSKYNRSIQIYTQVKVEIAFQFCQSESSIWLVCRPSISHSNLLNWSRFHCQIKVIGEGKGLGLHGVCGRGYTLHEAQVHLGEKTAMHLHFGRKEMTHLGGILRK